MLTNTNTTIAIARIFLYNRCCKLPKTKYFLFIKINHFIAIMNWNLLKLILT